MTMINGAWRCMTTCYNLDRGESMEIYDVVIIGAGPAGLTAAIYASRANLKTLMLEAETSGGKLYKTHEIENYPGVEKVEGSALADKLVKHSQEFGAELKTGKVMRIDEENSLKKVITEDGDIYYSKTVIVATGTKERLLKIPGALEHIGNGVSYCAVCDGFFYRNKPLVVIGAGNSGMEESLFLADTVSHITIVEMANTPLAEAKIVDAVKANPKIDVICGSTVESLIFDNNDKLIGANIKNISTGETKQIECNGVFPYMGADPVTDFVNPRLLDERGYIKVNPDMSTSIFGIYGAGDCVTKGLRQVITACNDGAIAANSVARLLKNS